MPRSDKREDHKQCFFIFYYLFSNFAAQQKKKKSRSDGNSLKNKVFYIFSRRNRKKKFEKLFLFLFNNPIERHWVLSVVIIFEKQKLKRPLKLLLKYNFVFFIFLSLLYFSKSLLIRLAHFGACQIQYSSANLVVNSTRKNSCWQ